MLPYVSGFLSKTFTSEKHIQGPIAVEISSCGNFQLSVALGKLLPSK